MVSSVITFDKITTKRTLAGRGINLAREVFLRRGEAFDAGARSSPTWGCRSS